RGLRPARPRAERLARPPLAGRPPRRAVAFCDGRPRPRRNVVARLPRCPRRPRRRDGGDRARGPPRARRGGNRRGGRGIRSEDGGGRVTVTPLDDVLAEASRILDTAADVPLRVLGGVAVALSADGALLLPREYNDIDFIAAAGRAPETVRAFEELGYVGDQRFNGLHGHRRLLFYDTANERRVDVFVAKFEMCHALPLAARLTLNARTIPLADLLLTKLQVFALNEKD